MNGWISAKERYPEKKGYYFFINGKNHLPYVANWDPNMGPIVDGELCIFTHWMPIPELEL